MFALDVIMFLSLLDSSIKMSSMRFEDVNPEFRSKVRTR